MLKRFPWLIVPVLFSLLAACATVEPELDRAEERSLAPAPLSAWPALREIADTDLFVPMNNGQSALDWRLRALQAATQSIDLQTFIWNTDAAGLALIQEVVAAADRGVKVRVILDDSFLAHADPALRALSEHPRIDYRIYIDMLCKFLYKQFRCLDCLLQLIFLCYVRYILSCILQHRNLWNVPKCLFVILIFVKI